jgi:hypothetical protein
MANIFNLKDKMEDIQEKIDIDELYERKRETDQSNLDLFNKILNKIHQKIKTTSRLFKSDTHCWYVVPEVMIGIPNFNHAECVAYVIEKLRQNGFNLRYFHPNTILISWGHWFPQHVREQIKKRLNKNIDGFGNVVEEKEKVETDMFGNKTDDNKKKSDYKATSTYVPSGKFIYNSDVFK